MSQKDAPVPQPSTDSSAAGESFDDERLAWLTSDGQRPAPRDVTLSMRLTSEERARVDQAAEAVGVTTAAYIRARVLGPGPDVGGWRAVYKLLLDLTEAVEGGEDAAGAVRDFKASFREVALNLFPESD